MWLPENVIDPRFQSASTSHDGAGAMLKAVRKWMWMATAYLNKHGIYACNHECIYRRVTLIAYCINHTYRWIQELFQARVVCNRTCWVWTGMWSFFQVSRKYWDLWIKNTACFTPRYSCMWIYFCFCIWHKHAKCKPMYQTGPRTGPELAGTRRRATYGCMHFAILVGIRRLRNGAVAQVPIFGLWRFACSWFYYQKILVVRSLPVCVRAEAMHFRISMQSCETVPWVVQLQWGRSVWSYQGMCRLQQNNSWAEEAGLFLLGFISCFICYVWWWHDMLMCMAC